MYFILNNNIICSLSTCFDKFLMLKDKSRGFDFDVLSIVVFLVHVPFCSSEVGAIFFFPTEIVVGF